MASGLPPRLQEDMRQDGEKLQDFDSQIEDQRARIDGNRTQISVLTAEAQALAESGVSIEAAEGGKRAQLDQAQPFCYGTERRGY